MATSNTPFPPENISTDPAKNATLGILDNRRTIRKFAEEPPSNGRQGKPPPANR